MRSGGFDKDADVIVMDAIGAAGAFNPRNLKEANAQSATMQQLGALHDYRQRRLSGNRWGMASFEWLVLMVGAACIVGFCWLFGLENENVHLMMTSAVTIIMTTTMVLLFELQCPFQSDLRIPPDDWNGVVSHIEFMQQRLASRNAHVSAWRRLPFGCRFTASGQNQSSCRFRRHLLNIPSAI